MSISSDITRIKGAKDDLKTAINAKGGSLTTELIDDYSAAVDAIAPGTDTSSATATASDILTGKTAYISDGTEATGTCDFNADTTDATADENSLLYGHTAYGADGTKLTGTGAYWQHAKSLPAVFSGSTTLPANTTIYAPLAAGLAQTFYNCDTIVNLHITISSVCKSFNTLSSGCGLLETVTIVGPMAQITNWATSFNNSPALHTITGTLNFSGNTGALTSTFTLLPALVNITVVPSTVNASISFVDSPLLSTTSLLSIANGLDAASEPKTLTMHATSKTNMNNINVDNVDGVAVLGSAMTLTQFINNIKGWTIA